MRTTLGRCETSLSSAISGNLQLKTNMNVPIPSRLCLNHEDGDKYLIPTSGWLNHVVRHSACSAGIEPNRIVRKIVPIGATKFKQREA